MAEAVEIVTAYTQIPYSVFATELAGSLKKDFQNEIDEIMKYYEVYKKGAEFTTEGSGGDYVPSDLRFKKIRDLIDKEARFLFSIPPTFTVNPNTDSINERQKEINTQLNEFLSTTLEKIQFNSDLVKAAKDCFIGKRVACILNFNDKEGITATFLNSTEFLYQFEGKKLSKIIAIFILQDSSNKAEQVIKKKVYSMENDGYCYVEEALYTGTGEILEDGRIEKTKTLFTRIPAVVIINDGLTNDVRGTSEVETLTSEESYYSKLSNADIDAGRKSMNPIRYTIDASDSSTQNLSSSPGSFWDLQSTSTSSDPHTAQAGMLEASMNYSAPLKTTLDRIENNMFSQLEIPNINSEKLQGVITSGKTLKALYWSLIVRCNEKMLTWGPALQYISEVILEGAKLYPEAARLMSSIEVPDSEVHVRVENNYPLPEDEAEEKSVDLAEIAAQTMSRKSYMKKWRNLTDKECDTELQQIAIERQLLEDSFMPPSDSEDLEE